MTTTFDPYHQWLGIAATEQPANHYRLLGVNLFERDVDVLQHAADQRMAHLRTFQTGPRCQLSQRLLNEVATALRCLLTPEDRARYDEELRREFGPKQPQPKAAVRAVPVQTVAAVPAPPPSSIAMPPPVPPPRAAAPTNIGIQISGAPANGRGVRSTLTFVAITKVVGGGVAGVSCGVVILWALGFAYPLEIFDPQTAASRGSATPVATSPPKSIPVMKVKQSPPRPSESRQPSSVNPIPVSAPTAKAQSPAPADSPKQIEPIPTIVTPTDLPQPLPLAESPLFLSDLQPLEVVALRVPPAAVRVRGQQSAHGIFLHPESNSTAKIAFGIGGKFRSLTGAAALNDSANGPTLSPLTMRVVGDGKTLWASQPIRAPGDAEAFGVDITGVARLELHVQCPGHDGRAHAAWFAVMADPAAAPNNANNDELEKLFPSGEAKPTAEAALPKADPVSEKTKLPRPAPDKLAAAEKTFAEVMGAEIAAAKSLEAKSKLADKLLQLGAAPGQDPASQFVVLSAACTRAVELGQLLKGLTLLEQRFDADLTDVRVQGFDSTKGQITSQRLEEFAEALLASTAAAEHRDRFAAAEELCKIGQAAGRKLNDRRFTDAFVDRAARSAKLANAYSLLKPSLLAAQANPDDQEAAFRAGQYIGYVRGDWKTALPLLARSTDEALRMLVQDDLKNPKDEAEILKLADRWWDRAETSSAMAQEGMRRRAAHWYRLIPPGKLQGLDAQKVAKRIAETETDWLVNWRPHSPAATFAKQVIGRYRLFTTDLGLKERTRRGLVKLEPNHDVTIETETGVVAHWRQDGQQLRFDFTADGRGHVELKPLRNRQWAGHHHRPSDKTVWGWELIPE